MDRLTAQAVTAVETGVERGARRAAREPVTQRANSTYGQMLDADRPFRDALKLRIYRAVRETLAGVTPDRRGLALDAALPPMETRAGVARALDRTTVSRAGPNGTDLRASVGYVTLTARRDGRVVGRTRIDPNVTLEVPVLPVHDRVTTFEERLDGGPTEPGLGRRLTATLYALTWARGYAQYAGVPIQNVVANRHLTLLTNGQVLATQRRVFGRSDPVGRRVHGAATLETAIMDVLAAKAPDVHSALAQARETVALGSPEVGADREKLVGQGPPAGPRSNLTVGVNASATWAFEEMIGSFNETINETFTADVRLRAQEVARSGSPPDWPGPPAADCSETDRDERRRFGVENRSASLRSPGGDWHRLNGTGRLVTITITRSVSWLCDGSPTTTQANGTETVALTLRLDGYHHNGPAPARPIDVVHEPAGRFAGPNLADVPAAAKSQLMPDSDTVDYRAKQAAAGETNTWTSQVTGDWPGALYPRVYEDVAAVREEVRGYAVNVSRGDVATMQASPVERLLERVENRTVPLADLPVTFANVSHRARVGAKLAYVTRVKQRLRKRIEQRETTRRTLGLELMNRENASLQQLQAAYEQRNAFDTSVDSPVEMRVNAAPSYLTKQEVTRADVPAVPRGESVHPLVVRNFNVFTLPYADVAKSILDSLVSPFLGPDHVRLRTGAQLLDNAAGLRAHNESIAADPRVLRLRLGVQNALDTVATRYGFWMEPTGLGSPDEWRDVFQDALATYNSLRARAAAVANREIVPKLVEQAADRWPERFERATVADRVAVRSEVTLRELLEQSASGPTRSQADGVQDPFRQALQDGIADRLGDQLKNASLETLRTATAGNWTRLPSGLPVTPLPGLWYATVNLWHTQARGEYVRFAVTVPQGTPTNPGASLAYVRDGHEVSVDVDGDGDPDRLGRASRVSFRTSTLVAIAVPPYSPGVGDIDGVQDERSPGWPWPSDPPPRGK